MKSAIYAICAPAFPSLGRAFGPERAGWDVVPRCRRAKHLARGHDQFAAEHTALVVARQARPGPRAAPEAASEVRPPVGRWIGAGDDDRLASGGAERDAGAAASALARLNALAVHALVDLHRIARRESPRNGRTRDREPRQVRRPGVAVARTRVRLIHDEHPPGNLGLRRRGFRAERRRPDDLDGLGFPAAAEHRNQ